MLAGWQFVFLVIFPVISIIAGVVGGGIVGGLIIESRTEGKKKELGTFMISITIGLGIGFAIAALIFLSAVRWGRCINQRTIGCIVAAIIVYFSYELSDRSMFSFDDL